MAKDLRSLLTVIFINFIGLTMYAQSGLKITSNEIPIGKNFLTHQDILAKEIVFPDNIYHTYIDSLSNCITVQLRYKSPEGKIVHNTGKVVVYDLSREKEKWSKKINYLQSNIRQHTDLFIQTTGRNSYSLNAENGEIQWQVKNALIHTDPCQKVGIGYKMKDFGPLNDMLQGIDLQNGAIRWEKKISQEYGLNRVFHLNDSTLIVVASGVHAVNLKNGSGWDFPAQTGEKIIFPNNYLIYDVVSNITGDSANFYFASKEKIARLNHNGQVVWSTPLPEKLTSKSHIFKKDSILYMVNYGYAFRFYKTFRYGTPFIAAFNANTGQQIYLNTTNGKREKINGFQIRNDQLYLIFKDKIALYSLPGGSFIKENTYKIELDADLLNYVGSHVYRKTDSIYNSLALADSTTHCIYTQNEKVLVINDQLEIMQTIDSKDLYLYSLKEKDCKFLVKGPKTIVIDDHNKEVAEINVAMKTHLIGTKFYGIRDKSFIELDINDILKKNIP